MSGQHTEEPAKLLALEDSVQISEYTLEKDTHTIGRHDDCMIVVRDTIVSRLHASIRRDTMRYLLCDEDSRNGTFVNGHLIDKDKPHVLKDRDLIGLGSPEGVLRFIDPDPTEIKSVRLRYDKQQMIFFLDDRPLALPPAQLRLLLHLYHSAGRVCTRESIAEAIWGPDFDPGRDANVDRVIHALRATMRQIDPDIDMIKNQRGIGYVLDLTEMRSSNSMLPQREKLDAQSHSSRDGVTDRLIQREDDLSDLDH